MHITRLSSIENQPPVTKYAGAILPDKNDRHSDGGTTKEP